MNQDQSRPRLAEMFSSYYEEVLAYCARRIGRSEAEDVTADVFAIAVRRAEEIDWATVRPWLYGIARGVLANRWRTVQRRQRLLMRMATFNRTSHEPPADVIVRRAEDHEALIALQSLRSTDREILMLAAWEEMSGPEIAQTLGISVSAAEQRLHRAKKRYARIFEPKVTPTSFATERTEP
jgi:RNA polymerase sigma-70 factor (ECF subfamily)